MKHLKKFSLLLLGFGLLFSISCSDDDEDSTVDLADVEFAFDASNPPIDQEVINALSSSTDPNALQISSNLTAANAMTAWLSLFQQPSGAQSSNVPIGTCGGDAIVYTYTGDTGSESFTVAYQICETSSAYIFQIFLSDGSSAPQEFIYAQQSKSGFEGYMEVYGAAIGISDISTDVVIRYDWMENSDGSFTYTVSDTNIGFLISIDINSDNSGEVEYVIDGDLYYEATWNASGTAGTYTYYNTDGSVLDSGNWPS